jgi:hypothetical protein
MGFVPGLPSYWPRSTPRTPGAWPSLCSTPTFFVSTYTSKLESDSTLADALAYRTAAQRS